MRGLAIATIISVLLAFFLAFNICSVEAAPFFSGIKIISPINSTYSSEIITLNVTADTIGGSNILFSMNFTLDDLISGAIPLTLQYPRNSMIAQHNGTVVLPALSEGEHKITVFANYTYPSGIQGQPPAPESSYYNSTVYFAIETTTQTPTPSTSPVWLTIDLADHNYLNNVLVGQPVNFSAVVSSGVPPYSYEWKYRPYYVGTVIGDFYPTGDWMEGPTTSNFTLTANVTGSYLIEVKVWDSAGAEGLFMSLPPGIWVNAKNSTSTQSPTPNPTPSFSSTPSPYPSPTPLSPPTQPPTTEPSSAPNPQENQTSVPVIVGAIVAVVVVIGLLVYVVKRPRKRS